MQGRTLRDKVEKITELNVSVIMWKIKCVHFFQLFCLAFRFFKILLHES